MPSTVSVKFSSYVPFLKSMTKSVQECTTSFRSQLSISLKEELEFGGSVSVDGAFLKVQSRNFCDFKLHHIDIVKPKLTDMPNFCIETKTILPVEAPENLTADRICYFLNDNLQRLYNVAIDDLQSRFTFVTDGVSAMEKIAGGSVSNRICLPN